MAYTMTLRVHFKDKATADYWMQRADLMVNELKEYEGVVRVESEPEE